MHFKIVSQQIDLISNEKVKYCINKTAVRLTSKFPLRHSVEFFIDPHFRETTSQYLPCVSCNQYNIILMSLRAQLTIVLCR